MLDGLAFLIVAAYLGVVTYRGNAKGLVAELKTDIPFIEFAVALGALGLLWRSPTLHPIGKMFILSAFILIGLRIIGQQQGLVSAIGDVAAGKTDPLAALKALAAPSKAGPIAPASSGYAPGAPWVSGVIVEPLTYGASGGGQSVGGASVVQ
jgi:hypothetical protein